MYYIFFIIFFLHNIIFPSSGPSVLAVHAHSAFSYSEPRNDGILPDDVYVSGGPGVLMKETYNSYCRILSETENTNDTQLNMLIKKSLFAQLCVQASKTNLDQKPFQDLLHKIRTGIINKNDEIIHLTEKDAKHRLLSYIPQGSIHLLINDKKAQLEFFVKREPVASKIVDNHSDDLVPCFKLGKGYVGNKSKPTGEMEINTNYNFESHPEHHSKIVAEFDALLTSFSEHHTKVVIESDALLTPRCYLAELPIDILNYIASFLEFPHFETDEEFIERTREYGKLSDEHENLLRQHVPQNYLPGKHLLAIRTYSIDRLKIVSLERLFYLDDLFCNNCSPIVTITDINTKISYKNTKLAALAKEDAKFIKLIAFSRSGKKFAQLHQDCIASGGVMDDLSDISKHRLIIKDVHSDKIQEFLIPWLYNDFISIGFNKQGTKIIAHATKNDIGKATDLEKKCPKSFHHIVQLAQTHENSEENQQKTLQEYFKQIICCKNFANNKVK